MTQKDPATGLPVKVTQYLTAEKVLELLKGHKEAQEKQKLVEAVNKEAGNLGNG